MGKNIQDVSYMLTALKKRKIAYRTDMKFSSVTTLGCGGKIAVVLLPDTARKLRLCVKLLFKYKIPYTVVGMGSKILASDCAYGGAVILTRKLNGVRFFGKKAFCQSGASCAAVFKQAYERSFSGGEFLSCLPATVGGAAVMNAGCFNSCMQNLIVSVTAIDKRGKTKIFHASKCGFSKRKSNFQNGELTLLSVVLRFEKGESAKIKSVSDEMLYKKRSTQPLDARSAGSVFYHRSLAVSKLIDEAGMKGLRIGGAEISKKHAGFIINVDKASSEDIYLLIDTIKEKLEALYGVVPELELRLVGDRKPPAEQNGV